MKKINSVLRSARPLGNSPLRYRGNTVASSQLSKTHRAFFIALFALAALPLRAQVAVYDTICDTTLDGISYLVLVSRDKAAPGNVIHARNSSTFGSEHSSLSCQVPDLRHFLANELALIDRNVCLDDERYEGRTVQFSAECNSMMDRRLVRARLLELFRLRCDTSTRETDVYELSVANPRRLKRFRDATQPSPAAGVPFFIASTSVVQANGQMVFSHVPLAHLATLLSAQLGRPVNCPDADPFTLYSFTFPLSLWQSDPAQALARKGLSLTPQRRPEPLYTFRPR